MKKHLAFITIFLLLLSFSCKKDNTHVNSEQNSELYYKSKLVTLINLSPVTDTQTKNTLTLKFNSYKEMYEAFKFVELGQVFKKTDSVKADNKESNSFKSLNGMSQSNHYIFQITDATNVNGAVMQQITDSYTVQFYVNYTQSGSIWIHNITSVQSSNPSFGYGGLGSLGGNSINMLIQNPQGTFSGFLQGTATVGGITSSFVITVSGGFTAVAGQTPNQYSYVNHSLMATFGGQNNPPPQ